MRSRIKICGISTPEIARETARLGADAIGLVFYSSSPRVVTADQARAIVEVLPSEIYKVGLFVDENENNINKILDSVDLDVLQFHGNETHDFCRQFAKPYIKAVRMRAGVDLHKFVSEYSDAKAVLLDTYIDGVQGGTGKTFDWSMIPKNIGKPVILAGGLTIDNVATAIRAVKPYAVDVSGGVESAKGTKDLDKIKAFIQEVKDAEF